MQHLAFSAKIRQNKFILLIRRLWTLTTVVGYIHTVEYLNANRDTVPKMIIAAARIAMGIVLAFFSLHIISTAYGEIAEEIVLQAGAAVAAVIFLAVFIIMAYGLFLSWGHLRATWNEPQAERPAKLLSAKAAQTWTPPDIFPDILVADFDRVSAFQKAEDAKEKTSYHKWAVIIPRNSTAGTICRATPETSIIFERGEEPFAGIVPAEFSLPVGLDHINEDERQYQQYVTWFCHWYKQWRDTAKLQAKTDRADRTILEVMEAHAKAVTAALCFILLCLPAFGQSKAQQVDAALGSMNSDVPKRGDEITFIFEEGGKEKYYNRTGDGRSEYIDLLRRTTGIVRYNDEGGQLVAITKNGALVARGAMVERVNLSPSTASSREAPNGYATQSVTSDPIRPRGAIPTAGEIAETPRTDMPLEMSFPDSAEMVDRVDRMQYEMYKAGRYANSVIRPWWELFMWAYWDWFWLICIVTGVSWLFASSFATEGFWSVHRNAKIILLGVTVASASIFIVNIILWAKWIGIGPFWLAVITGVLCGSAYWLLIKINPDFRPARGNDPRAQDDPYANNRQRALPAGR